MDYPDIDVESYYQCLSDFGRRVLTNLLSSAKYEVSSTTTQIIYNNPNTERLRSSTPDFSEPLENLVNNVTNTIDKESPKKEKTTTIDNSKKISTVQKTTIDFASFKAPPKKPKNNSAIHLLSLDSGDSNKQNVDSRVPSKPILTEPGLSGIKKSVTRRDKMKTVNNWLGTFQNNPKPTDFKNEKKNETQLKRKGPQIQTQIVSDKNGRMSYGKNNPSKITDLDTKDEEEPKEKPIFLIESLNNDGYEKLLEKVGNHQPEEICFTMLFKEGVCQLSKDLSVNEEQYSPTSLMFYFKWFDEHKYYIMSIRRISKEEKVKQKNFIGSLMNLKTRKICFETQETIMLLTDLYKFKTNEINLEWLIIDPKIGLFLLNPDNAPQTFPEILQKLSIKLEVPNGKFHTKCAYLLNTLSAASYLMYDQLRIHDLWDLYINLEIFITPILAMMELTGIHIDTKTFNENASILSNYIKDLEKEIFLHSGKEFAINSPTQVAKILYEELKLDSKFNVDIEETKCSKSKSTSEANLKKLALFHPLPNLILEYRQFCKAKAAFVDSILKQSSSGIIRSTWDQASAATGRITSSNPNLQAIPKEVSNISHIFDDEELLTQSNLENYLTVNLRNGFIARPSYTLVAADFQNIECRIFAHLSNDSNLINLFRSNLDIFEELTRKWLDKKQFENVLPSERMKTKKLVYALMYGAGYKTICEILKKDFKQANTIITKFYEFFPGLKSFSSDILKKCRNDNNTLKSISGRKRFFENINNPITPIRKQAERQAINFIIQGSAADICKKAMIVTEQYFSRYSKSLEHHLLLQIHDELVWEVPDDAVNLFTDAIKDVANHVDGFFNGISVPLPVLIKTGKLWGSMNVV